jgi:hypothetical protein
MRREVTHGIATAILGLAVALALQTGCSQPVASGSSAPVTNPPQADGPAASSNAIFSDPSIIGAGSFPRSFLIPGTDTSIRIGG